MIGYVVRVPPRMDAKKMCFKDIELCAQNVIIILGSIVNIIWEPI